MNLMVGKPLTPYFEAKGLAELSSALRWATAHRSSEEKVSAILVQVGSSDLQWPHCCA